MAVSPAGAGTTSPAAGTHTYEYGDVVPIEATPATGWQFDYWEGDITGSANPDTVTMTGDKTVTAVFTKIPVTLTMAISPAGAGAGTTTPSAGTHTYYEGDIVDISASPSAGWQFDHWEGSLSGSTNPTTITMDSDKAVTAVFTRIPHDLTMQVTGQGTTIPSAGTHTYYEGDIVDISASPSAGWQFDHWEGGLSGSTNPKSIMMTSDKTVRAVFFALEPSIGIVKEASAATATVGDTITYTYTVTNTGKVTLTDVSATDDVLGAVVLGATALGPGESTSGTLSYTVQESDLPWPLVNSVTVVGTSPLGESIEGVSPPIIVHLLPAKEPMIDITITVDRVTARVNDAVTYTYTVTNRGDTKLTNVRVSDNLLGVIGFGKTTLLPGESTTGSATYIVQESDLPGPLKNVATASATDAFGAMAMDQASATVTLEQVDEAEKAIEEALEGKVVISEVAWAGTPSDPWGEWIELRNLGTAPVDLTDWTLRWRRKHPSNPEQSRWKVIALSGALMPAAVSARGHGARRSPPSVRIVKNDRDDISWWVLCELQEKDEGCYLLERWHDATVSNIAADLIYGAEEPYDMGLSDLGDIVELLDDEEQIIDTANAFEAEEDGWPAGSAITSATMERVDLLGPDVPDNWCTNLGIISNGLDPLGGLLLGTPGVTNSVVLAEVGLLSDLQPTECSQGKPVRVGLELPKESKKDAGWPRIIVVDELARAGGDGGYQTSYSFSGHYEAQTYWLDIDTSGLPPGRYNLWIVCGEGKTLLVPITVVP